MKILLFISEVSIPMIIFYIILYGLIQKVNVYESFITGAADGLKTVVKILPTQHFAQDVLKQFLNKSKRDGFTRPLFNENQKE